MARRQCTLVAAGLATATALALVLVRGVATAHEAAHFSAGEPGNPKNPSRVVRIMMRESNGRMMFEPDQLEVKRGEQIRFVLTNAGELEHEFVLATTEENLKHYEEMKKNPDMEHDDPNGRRLKPKGRGELLWRFTKPGRFEYGCLIPGHREAGMTGIVIVK
jgi:uncharacterized cupredoxin-like copper-binding protein